MSPAVPDLPSVPELAANVPGAVPTYREFLRVPSMSLGIYRLAAGSVDEQRPHGEDEVYYVVQGRARFRQGERERPIAAGDLLFVPAREPHRFLSIEEELVLLVFFAPPEGAAGATGSDSP